MKYSIKTLCTAATISVALTLTGTVYARTAPICPDTSSDPDGDGWGWDGTQSCLVPTQPMPQADCIDSPPVGDGWGWDGSTSCRIDAGPAECVDSPPVGDGWGWDGVSSCRVETVPARQCIDSSGNSRLWNGVEACTFLAIDEILLQERECIDSPPLGNGWGWDGFDSCLVETGNLVKNGNFANGSSDWTTFIHPSAQQSEFMFDYQDLRFSYFDAGTQWWHSQAYSAPIALEGGSTYRLQFTNSSGGKTLSGRGSVVIENGVTFQKHLDRQDFRVSPGTSKFTAEFYVPVSDNNARITFNLGDNGGESGNSSLIGTVWFDRIVLKKID